MTTSFLVLLVFLGYRVKCELIRQCTCDEIQDCRKQLLNFVKPCADRCQRYAHAIKANYEMLKYCVLQNEAKIIQTINCTENIFYNSCAAKPGQYVQKTYFESLEIAGLAEINRMLGNFARSLQPLIAIGRRFLRCTRECIHRSSKYCFDHFDCGLDLPANSILIRKAKHCALASGFDSKTVQWICVCAVSAGIGELKDICPHLKIS
ncbi:unnamed protein product [Litomosoides sigmodontis]|uniref:Chondroitin proteoglycan 4 domain-containing protein n=1 Tax=Litomosoides sigmodontis TaxID=42156 RepID=A0A3P6SLN2_LITSI|nr:unnamed protein product [Litomosoides sigmodontis]